MPPKLITFINWIFYIAIGFAFIQAIGDWYGQGTDILANPIMHGAMLLSIMGFLFNQNVKPSESDEKQSKS
ncbi:hypothetical protein Q4567_02390 [Aliiglaciecola sp. 2_MG-2023]|uniref:hypothetical protein n=1 Tax=Alteromonadaceae TaxID=72275 RepID=UPI0026E438EB|nr:MULTISPECIES: hypothetical protein [unclassified Aliiglaciecola]MDO6709563.1 hypothetical protein [Aliiglaciecola sp. 2_MG-2023]MDO6750895.1 hypothetical protein [Aliiglaciecola sp. 1_MG-2023]